MRIYPHLHLFNEDYFKVLNLNPDEITITSRNTHHTWRLVCSQTEDLIVVFHKHKDSHPFHFHTACISVEDAVLEIKNHDAFQLNGRRPVFPVYTRTGVIMPRQRRRQK
ncbi:hypothetical protein [Oribacterium sp. Sow4_G1_1]|uniref:hypothetical protein n=1 Tax=Oribacterium sp. Sow4_G1_1 TaxID=3438794 RepID=UPI003F94855B